eukprot:3882792-Rhodomonas_salina.5
MMLQAGVRLNMLVLLCQVWSAHSFSPGVPVRLQLRGTPVQHAIRSSPRLSRNSRVPLAMLFPGESSNTEGNEVADLVLLSFQLSCSVISSVSCVVLGGQVGFWQLINSTPDEESGIERLVFRADNQIGGSPRFPEWEGAQVSWAGAQMSAGGSWKEYVGSNGNKRVEFCLLAPLKGAFERASGERQAMFYNGVVLVSSESAHARYAAP